MAIRIGLIRPGNKGKGYQGLANVKALEPPHWMLCRATQLRQEYGHRVAVVDMAYQGRQDIPDCDSYELWPTGNHPSAYLQEQEEVSDLLYALGGRGVVIMDKLPEGLAEFSPAWDLVDLSKYRTHNWHTWGQPSNTPYGTVHTSINCPFGCSFCAVREYYGQKYWERSMVDVLFDLRELQGLGVRNIKIMDEIFCLKEGRVWELCTDIVNKGNCGFNFWTYGRVDTLTKFHDSTLSMMKLAGINWIGLGIESGNEGIRHLNGKNGFTNTQVVDLIHRLQGHGISVVGNFIFGFPQDTKDTLRETFKFAYDLRCEYTNFYCMVAYPDTPLESYAKAHGWYTPQSPLEYAQYDPTFHPLQTHALTSMQVLATRDWAYQAVHNTARYREMIEKKFGESAVVDVEKTCTVPLHRNVFNGTWEDYYTMRGTNGA